MNLGLSIELSIPFAEAMTRTREALIESGFGIVSEIDLQKTFRAKIQEEFHPLVILGACNPKLAKEAIEELPDIALLMPCNVTVEEVEAGKCRISTVLAEQLVTVLPQNSVISRIAKDADARLVNAIRILQGG